MAHTNCVILGACWPRRSLRMSWIKNKNKNWEITLWRIQLSCTGLHKWSILMEKSSTQQPICGCWVVLLTYSFLANIHSRENQRSRSWKLMWSTLKEGIWPIWFDNYYQLTLRKDPLQVNFLIDSRSKSPLGPSDSLLLQLPIIFQGDLSEFYFLQVKNKA